MLSHEEKEGGYAAELPVLPGCLTQAATQHDQHELMDMVKDAQRAWIEATYAEGREIPLPRTKRSIAAEEFVRSQRMIRLSVRSSKAFVDVLENPSVPNERLRNADRRYRLLLKD